MMTDASLRVFPGDAGEKIGGDADRERIFDSLCEKVKEALGCEELKKAELANLAMAAAALETEREAEILFAGIERSRGEGCPADIRFRILDKAYKYHCMKQGGKPLVTYENIYRTLRNSWLAGRLDTFVVSGRVKDLPDFYKKRIRR